MLHMRHVNSDVIDDDIVLAEGGDSGDVTVHGRGPHAGREHRRLAKLASLP